MSRLMTKPTNWPVRPAKTQISLGFRPVWSESSLSLSRLLKGQAFIWRTAKTLIRLGGAPGWSESSLGAQAILCFCHEAAQMQDKANHTLGMPSTLTSSALNRVSSHHCGFEPSSGHMSDKPSYACGWSGGISQGSPVYAPPNDWLSS